MSSECLLRARVYISGARGTDAGRRRATRGVRAGRGLLGHNCDLPRRGI